MYSDICFFSSLICFKAFMDYKHSYCTIYIVLKAQDVVKNITNMQTDVANALGCR